MVLEHQAGYESQWAAMVSMASKIGCIAETLGKWVRGAERDAGVRPCWPSSAKWGSAVAGFAPALLITLRNRPINNVGTA